MAEEKNNIVKYVESIEDAQNKAINQLRDDLSEARNKIESLSKDTETYKSAFMRSSAECDSLKDKIKSLKTIVNLL